MAETGPLTDGEHRVWRSYQRLSIRVFSQLNRDLLQEAGISLPDYEVLQVLAETTENRLRAYELGAELQWEKSRLSHHLKRMENRGLIARVVCESDARGLWVTLSQGGADTLAAAAPVHDRSVRQSLLHALSPEQGDVLAEIYEKALADMPAETDLCEA